jgi:hypothetical protein
MLSGVDEILFKAACGEAEDASWVFASLTDIKACHLGTAMKEGNPGRL